MAEKAIFASMGISREMHQKRRFDSDWEYRELRRMLSEAIANGYVEQVPVLKQPRLWSQQEWYRDKETGEVFTLMAPEEKNRGWWERVDIQDLIEPGEQTQ